jgi:multiple antibiotic resistance protein
VLEGLLLFTGYARFFVTLAAVLGCILAVCALTWITLSLAGPIGTKLGTTGLNIATRLLGLLLAALAIQTMAEGLRRLFPGLA